MRRAMRTVRCVLLDGLHNNSNTTTTNNTTTTTTTTNNNNMILGLRLGDLREERAEDGLVLAVERLSRPLPESRFYRTA